VLYHLRNLQNIDMHHYETILMFWLHQGLSAPSVGEMLNGKEATESPVEVGDCPLCTPPPVNHLRVCCIYCIVNSC